MKIRLFVTALLALLAAGCASPSSSLYLKEYQALYHGREPTPSDFFTCHHWECKSIERVSLTPEEWGQAIAPLAATAPDARSERRQIAQGVVIMEGFTGERMAATPELQGEYFGGDSDELDCIDDSINTWVYMTMLQHEGLLVHHKVGGIAHGGSLLTMDIRNSAVLVVMATGEEFAIDPTQAKDGGPPPTFPLALWEGDWPPDMTKAEHN
ncbi:MAG TPA: hypothetical protein VMG55_20935 [Stellaceae bacterium]|nr:hypothetical protein [Stellaceae bacterium]